MKGILVVIIVINIILITFMTFFVPSIHKYTYEEYRISIEGENPELEAALKIRILPENRSIIEEKYKGTLNFNYMYEKLYDLVHTNLPIIQNEIKNLGITELNQYLKNNQNKMLVQLGITNIEQLSKSANNILNCNIQENEYINASFNEASYQQNELYDSFEIVLNYKSCKLYFRIYMANNMLTSPMVIFESTNGGAL